MMIADQLRVGLVGFREVDQQGEQTLERRRCDLHQGINGIAFCSTWTAEVAALFKA